MPILRINIPNENYEELKNNYENFKKVMNYLKNHMGSDNTTTITTTTTTTTTTTNNNNVGGSDVDLDFNLAFIVSEIKYELKFYKKINFNEVFPGYNFDEILPQLQIGEDGYAKFDVEEVFAGYDYDPEHYRDLNIENINDMVYKSNKNFDIVEIRETIYNLKMAIDNDEFYEKYNDITMESWEIEQINKYIKYSNDDEIYGEYETDINYMENVDEFETDVNYMENVDDFDTDNNFMEGFEIFENFLKESDKTSVLDMVNFKTKNATMTFEING